MGFLQNLDDYLATIQMSNVKHLLVEGVSDKLLFERFFHFHNNFMIEANDIEIDIADDLDIYSEFGNRGKVELICESVQGDLYLKDAKFAGFVDREFRDFEYEETICDLLDCHKVIGCLVWSRGHSIENYLFEYSILSELFRDLLNIESKLLSDSLNMFKEILNQAICIACSIGLAAYSVNRIQKIRETINWTILEDSSSYISLNVTSWKSSLVRKLSDFDKDSSETLALTIIDKYESYLQKLEKTDIKIVRWLCDGHIGFELILAAYCCCLHSTLKDYHNSKIDSLIGSILSIKKNKFFHCTNWWARQSMNNQCSYPLELFQILQIYLNFEI